VNLLVVSGIVIGACAITCGVLFAFHRLGKSDVMLADTTRGAGVYAVVGTSFAVLLAFVVLIAFQSFTDAREGAEAEADVVIEISRNSQYFPSAQQERIQGDLVCYGRAVAVHDWPAMQQEERSPVTDHWALALQGDYEALQVETPKEQWAFGELLDLSDQRIDARRQRLTQGRSIVTAPVWFILGLGALFNVLFVLLFIDRRSERFGVQAFLMTSVTAIVVAGLLLVWFLDHPYEDKAGSIQPTEIRNSVAILEAQNAVVAPPCSKDGQPL
jgi:hypothetical protein